MIIKGCSKLKEGEYQGHKYANYTLYGVDKNTGEWRHEKVPKKVLDDAGVFDPNVMIENDLQIFYNRFGKVEYVKVGD